MLRLCLNYLIFVYNCIFSVFQLSWADLFFVAVLDYLNFMAKINLLEGRPKLQTLKEQVLAVPQIKTWVEKRPKGNP